MGAALKPYVDRGMMVPDNLFTKLVVERLWEEDCVTKGWALDGFPLTRAQAQGLSKAGFVPNLVVFLDSAPQVCIDRLVYRRTDPVTGRRYHLTLNPPPSEEVLGRLRQHPEDEEEAVQRRLMDYGAFAAELRDFYSKVQTFEEDEEGEEGGDGVELVVCVCNACCMILNMSSPPTHPRTTFLSSADNDAWCKPTNCRV